MDRVRETGHARLALWPYVVTRATTIGTDEGKRIRVARWRRSWTPVPFTSAAGRRPPRARRPATWTMRPQESLVPLRAILTADAPRRTLLVSTLIGKLDRKVAIATAVAKTR